MIKKKPVAQDTEKKNKVGESLLRLQNDIKQFIQRTTENK